MLVTLLGVILDMALPAPITLRTGYNQESDAICTVAIHPYQRPSAPLFNLRTCTT